MPAPVAFRRVRSAAASVAETSAFATDRTADTSDSCCCLRPTDTSPLGFSKKSTAPFSIASNVNSAPSAAWADSTNTGVGRSVMIRSTASMPSTPGIFRSIVTTSGSVSRTVSTPSAPFEAVPSTSMPASSSMSQITVRMNCESSTTTALTGSFPPRWVVLVRVMCPVSPTD